MLVIHDLETSRSQRILWLVEELGIDYKLVRHQRDAQTMRSPQSLWDVSPMGKAPVIEDDGKTLAESGAIIEYILDRHGDGKLRPAADSAEYLAYRHWMHAAESTLITPVLLDLLMSLTQTQSEGLAGFADSDMKTVLGYLDSELGQREFVAGNAFSGADIMVWYPAYVAFNAALPGIDPPCKPGEYPNIIAWLGRMSQRPAYQKAMALSQGAA